VAAKEEECVLGLEGEEAAASKWIQELQLAIKAAGAKAAGGCRGAGATWPAMHAPYTGDCACNKTAPVWRVYAPYTNIRKAVACRLSASAVPRQADPRGGTGAQQATRGGRGSK
jgi:hypothetical protein